LELPKRPSPSASADPRASGGPVGGHVLVVEPDHLTMWSLAAYLRRWFAVDTTNCRVEAEKLLHDQTFAAVIVSDQLPARATESLLQLARRTNPQVRAVLLVTGVAEARALAACDARIEKPFELAALARLLGIEDGRG